MTEHEAPAAVGRTVGRYLLRKRIASGGMGSVFLATARGVGGFERAVAVKVLHPHLAEDEEFVAMFLDEARLAARIHHPNVVATIDVLGAPDFVIVMEYVEGIHLGVLARAAQREREKLPTAVIVRIVLDALDGLGAAHELVDDHGALLGLVHRDVSPQNVLIGVDGTARLTDFGVARAEARLSSTRDGTVKGKLGYMAPEHASGLGVDHRGDLFAMGVVLWEVLAGQRLFSGDSDAEIMARVTGAPIAPISSVDPRLAPLDAVLGRALSRNPDARYASARAMAEALETAAESLGGVATPRKVGETVKLLAGDRIEAVRAAKVSSSEAAGTPPSDDAKRFDEITRPGTTGARRRRAEQTRATVASPSQASRAAPPPRHSRLGLAIAAVVALCSLGLIAERLTTATAEPRSETAAPLPVAASAVPDSEPSFTSGLPPEAPPSSSAVVPTIITRVRIGPAGEVREAIVVGPRPDLAAFEERALASVRTWRFEPAMRVGAPVEAWLRVPVDFTPRSALAGLVRIKGSDTLGGSLLPDLARRYHDAHDAVRIDVEANGSSTAFIGLFDGSADLGASSRAVRAEELTQAHELDIVLHELLVGWDGIAVIVHPDAAVASLTMAQLADIYRGTIVDMGDVSGTTGAIHLVARPEESGTHAFFAERVMGGSPDLASAIRIEHSEEVVRYVASDPHAIGYVGMGYVTSEVRVVALAVDERSSPIEPDRRATEDGSYPLGRPLLLYLRDRPTPAALDFARFVFSEEARRSIAEHGFVPVDRPPLALASLEPGDGAPARVPLRLVFEEGESALDAASRDALDRWIDSQPRDARFVATGHAVDEDDLASLSTGRAEAAASALGVAGIPASRIIVHGVRDTQPLAPRGSDAGRRLGRRVDVFAIVR